MRKAFLGGHQLIALIIRSNALLFLVEWSPPGVSNELSGQLCALPEALRVIEVIKDCAVKLFGREGYWSLQCICKGSVPHSGGAPAAPPKRHLSHAILQYLCDSCSSDAPAPQPMALHVRFLQRTRPRSRTLSRSHSQINLGERALL